MTKKQMREKIEELERELRHMGEKCSGTLMSLRKYVEENEKVKEALKQSETCVVIWKRKYSDVLDKIIVMQERSVAPQNEC